MRSLAKKPYSNSSNCTQPIKKFAESKLSDTNSHIKELVQRLLKHSYKVAVAESCTGGMLAQEFTSLAGSSTWFECGFVSYSNASKIMTLDVDAEVINKYGAVSEETAIQMAVGVLQNSHAKISAAITGIAGPGGGTEIKPVGTVYISTALKNADVMTVRHQFEGDRQMIRHQCVEQAILQLNERMNG